MIFKNTNFVHQSKFVLLLKDKKIIKRLIPLGQPQCNGCIERFHLTMDNVCSSSFLRSKNLNEINQVVQSFSNYYNFNRYHYYSE